MKRGEVKWWAIKLCTPCFYNSTACICFLSCLVSTPQKIVASTLPEMQNIYNAYAELLGGHRTFWCLEEISGTERMKRGAQGPYRNISMWLRSVVRHSRNLNWAFLWHEFSKQGLGLKFLNSKKCRARLVLNYVHCSIIVSGNVFAHWLPWCHLERSNITGKGINPFELFSKSMASQMGHEATGP